MDGRRTGHVQGCVHVGPSCTKPPHTTWRTCRVARAVGSKELRMLLLLLVQLQQLLLAKQQLLLLVLLQQ